MKTEMTKDLQKKVTKYGSVLQAFRSQGGEGKGLIGAGVMLLVLGVVCGLLLAIASVLGGLIFIAFFAVLSLPFILSGKATDKKRVAGYLEYYQEETGYSVWELQEADRELMSPEAVKIVSRTDRSGRKKETVFFVTEHYFLAAWPVNGCYLRKLDDIVAAFYSNQIPRINRYRQNLFIITQQDTEMQGWINERTKKQYRGFENGLLTSQKDCYQICMEVLDEMAKRAPHIITSQNIAVRGIRYDLLSMDNWQWDWANILGS